MLEVRSSGINESTGHARMVVYSTLTKCELSLIETESGILTYKKCPKKLTQEVLIKKLQEIKDKHLRITTRKTDLVCDMIDELVIDIPKMWSNETENISLEGVVSIVSELDKKGQL
jgi:hypothetical protein